MRVTAEHPDRTSAAAAPNRSVMPFFDRLAPSAQATLLGLGRRRSYPSRSIVFFEEDVASSVLVIREGTIKLSINVHGHEVLLDILGPGDVLGELSVIEGRGRSATAITLTPVDALSIPGPAFMDVVRVDPDIAGSLLLSVAGRLRNASQRQVESGALDAIGRVCRRLIEMADRFGRPGRHGITIDGPLTQADIAAWAGLSREAVVKAFHSMRALGWVETGPRTITVLDRSAVSARASLYSV